MAKHLARIHGTEEDKVNCPFYYKIGACRHMDKCSRIHHKPTFSPTLLIKHVYKHPSTIVGLPNPNMSAQQNNEQQLEDFLCFYEDFYLELSKYGKIDGLYIVDNIGDHLIGHVYAKFQNEEQAADVMEHVNNRFYDGVLIQMEYSPVIDFREARCRDYDEDVCSRAGFCNFLHIKPIPNALIRSLEEDANSYRQQQHSKNSKRRNDSDRRSSSASGSGSKRHRSSKEDDHDESSPGGGDEERTKRSSKRSSEKKHRRRNSNNSNSSNASGEGN